MPDHIDIVHSIPGRIRARIPHLKGRRELCDMVVENATSIEGVQSAQANPLTGSVVVLWNKDDPQMMKRLQGAMDDLDLLIGMSVAGETDEDADEETDEKPGSARSAESGGALLPLLVVGGGMIASGDPLKTLSSPFLLGSLLFLLLGTRTGVDRGQRPGIKNDNID